MLRTGSRVPRERSALLELLASGNAFSASLENTALTTLSALSLLFPFAFTL